MQALPITGMDYQNARQGRGLPGYDVYDAGALATTGRYWACPTGHRLSPNADGSYTCVSQARIVNEMAASGDYSVRIGVGAASLVAGVLFWYLILRPVK
jgi:hypothetical protein